MGSKIEFKDIVKLQKLYIEIFEAEDEDIPDGRIISSKEKAVQRILDRITSNDYKQREIWYIIQTQTWNREDITYKPICDDLRNLGFEIIGANNGK